MESFEALDKASTKCFNFINRIELVLPWYQFSIPKFYKEDKDDPPILAVYFELTVSLDVIL
jgi:hypothetical protein